MCIANGFGLSVYNVFEKGRSVITRLFVGGVLMMTSAVLCVAIGPQVALQDSE